MRLPKADILVKCTAGEKEKKSAKQSELQGDDTEEWILNNPVIDYIRVGPSVWMAVFAREI